MAATTDVLVIGAGAAGLSAAGQLASAGLSVAILEARSRLGGRLFTQTDPELNVPIELGAEFIHGLPPEIWAPLQANKTVITEVSGEPWCSENGAPHPCNFFQKVDQILERMDDRLPDESFSSFLRRLNIATGNDPSHAEAARRALAYVVGFNAADPDRVGVHWLIQGMRAEEKIEGHRAFRSAQGYADLLSLLRQQVETSHARVLTDTVVESVQWRRGHATTTTRSGDQFSSRSALVTLPLGILKASPGEIGAVRFSPDFPPEKVQALAHMEMGHVLRITLRFRTRFWETMVDSRDPEKTLANMSFLLSQDEWFPTWWTTAPPQLPMITGWAPFRCADKLGNMSRSAIIEQSLRSLGNILGVDHEFLSNELKEAHFYDWQADPFSRGAYSYGTVGADGAQAALARPLEDTVFFAGEATDITGNNGTVHAALASADRATKEILRSLK